MSGECSKGVPIRRGETGCRFVRHDRLGCEPRSTSGNSSGGGVTIDGALSSRPDESAVRLQGGIGCDTAVAVEELTQERGIVVLPSSRLLRSSSGMGGALVGGAV